MQIMGGYVVCCPYWEKKVLVLPFVVMIHASLLLIVSCKSRQKVFSILIPFKYPNTVVSMSFSPNICSDKYIPCLLSHCTIGCFSFQNDILVLAITSIACPCLSALIGFICSSLVTVASFSRKFSRSKLVLFSVVLKRMVS